MDIEKFLGDRIHGLDTEANFSFARHTTIGCGGMAAVCAYPKTEEELIALLALLKRRGIPYCFLGVGANVLPADGRFEGVIVRFTRFSALSAQGTDIFCGAGVTAGALLRFAQARGIGGLEFLTGIPASLGGAVVMNAGVKEGHLSDVVHSVAAVEGGKARIFRLNECGFSEKYSVFQSGIAVTGVLLKGRPASQAEIAEKRGYFRAKRARLPKGRSMGCVFVNPEGGFAGELIDRSGCKGLSVGGAFVSEEHANFIINGGATSADIAKLIDLVKERVFAETGIRLREEIMRLP